MLGAQMMTKDPAEFHAEVGLDVFPQVAPSAVEFAAYRGADAILWHFRGADGRLSLAATGDAEAALAMAAAWLAHAAEDCRCNLPRIPHERVTAVIPDVEPGDWEIRRSVEQPPARPGEERVVTLRPNEDEYARINAILDAALPTAYTRPGSPRVANWYGIRDGADDNAPLLAVAADCSSHGVGMINSIGVRPDLQGHGLGGALTAAVTRRLRAENKVVQLGVVDTNIGAQRLYARLGYTDVHALTSFTRRIA